MSILVNGLDGNPFDILSIDMRQRFYETIYRLVLSGNYVTSGDTLDFTNGGVNSAVPPSSSIVCVNLFSNGPAAGASGIGTEYYPVCPAGGLPSTNVTGWKMTAWLANGTQLTGASAYPAANLADFLVARVLWKKAA